MVIFATKSNMEEEIDTIVEAAKTWDYDDVKTLVRELNKVIKQKELDGEGDL